MTDTPSISPLPRPQHEPEIAAKLRSAALESLRKDNDRRLSLANPSAPWIGAE